jgi:hypothetical protein
MRRQFKLDRLPMNSNFIVLPLAIVTIEVLSIVRFTNLS